jgi:hypothetical protein
MDEQPSYEQEKLANRHRLLKGDLEISRDPVGYINLANVRDDTALGHLICRKNLDHDHLNAAATYRLWQHAFTKPLYAEPRKIDLIEIAGGQLN